MTSFLRYILYMLALLTAKNIEKVSVGTDKVVVMDEFSNGSQQPMRQPSSQYHQGQNSQRQQPQPEQPRDHNEQSDSGYTEEQCGGILTAPHGVIQTPNFPDKFPVPITCVWIIDASELATGPNVSIVVYLTQLYVLSGLKFTEYMYYSNDYKVPSHRVFEMTEDDVTQVA